MFIYCYFSCLLKCKIECSYFLKIFVVGLFLQENAKTKVLARFKISTGY